MDIVDITCHNARIHLGHHQLSADIWSDPAFVRILPRSTIRLL